MTTLRLQGKSLPIQVVIIVLLQSMIHAVFHHSPSAQMEHVKWATFHCNKGTADTNVSVVSEQTQQDTHVL